MDAEGVRYDSAKGKWVLATTVLGSSIVFLDGTVVNVALPDIGRELDATTASLQWILNGYTLTLAALILLGGALGDRLGRRRMFTFGVAWFTLASALCAAAPNAEVLIAARMLQGIGGALLTPGSLAIIEATFRKEDRGPAIGAWSGLGGVAAAVGPLLGGYLVDAVSWRAIFLINLPLGALVIAMAARHVPETKDPNVHGRLDYAGAALAAVGLAGTTYALIEGPSGISPAILIPGIGGVVALGLFFVQERRSDNPMMSLDIFRSHQFSAANAVTFVVYGAMGGVFFLLVAFLQISLGYDPIAAGAASLPITVLMLAFSARSGALAQRIGARIPLTVGPLIIALGMLLMIRIDPGDSYFSTVFPAVVVFGVGLTFVVAPVTATVLAAADSKHAGMASGINNAVSRVAGLLAVAVLPLAAGITGDKFYDPEILADGFHTAMFVCAAAAALGGIIAWLTIDADVLDDEDGGEPSERPRSDRICPVSGAPLSPDRDPEPAPAALIAAVQEPNTSA